MGRATPATPEQIADLERRLAADEWLGASDLAKLFGRDETTIQRWAARGWLKHTKEPGQTGKFLFDPADVRTLLASRRHVHGGTPPAPPSEQSDTPDA